MIIITGGAGFIGSNLVNELLNYKHKIVICDYKKKINSQILQILQILQIRI